MNKVISFITRGAVVLGFLGFASYFAELSIMHAWAGSFPQNKTGLGIFTGLMSFQG